MGVNKFCLINNRDNLFYNKLSYSFCSGKENKEAKENKENKEEKVFPSDSKDEKVENKTNPSEDTAAQGEKTKPKKDFIASLKKLLFGKGASPAKTNPPKHK